MCFIRVFFLAVLAVFMLACQELDTSHKASAKETEQLHRLFQDEWERYLRENPVFASSLGDRRYNDQWGDNSLEAIRASYEADKKALKRLHDISQVALSASEKLNYDLFERQLKTGIEGFQYRAFLMPLDQLGGVQSLHEVAERLRFQTKKDFHDWIVRLNQINRVIKETMDLMKVGLKEGRTQPKIIMKRIVPQIALQVVDSPEESPFYQVFREMPESISTTVQTELRKQAKQAIANIVIPAYRRFHIFFNQQYLQNCREHRCLCVTGWYGILCLPSPPVHNDGTNAGGNPPDWS
jgi:prolyl oligopeptidase